MFEDMSVQKTKPEKYNLTTAAERNSQQYGQD